MNRLRTFAAEWIVPLLIGLPIAGLLIYLESNGHHAATLGVITAGASALGAFLGVAAADDEPIDHWSGWTVLAGAVFAPWLLTLFWVLPRPMPDEPELIDSLIRVSWTLAITMMGAWVIKQPRSRWVHLLFIGLATSAMGFLWLQHTPRIVSGGVFVVLFCIPWLVEVIRPRPLDSGQV